jgi:hypothetical protein
VDPALHALQHDVARARLVDSGVGHGNKMRRGK